MERAQEHHLRRSAAVAAHFLEHAKQGEVLRLERLLIRHIENQSVHSGIRQHLGVLAQHERIISLVVAEDRLTPMMRGVHRPPLRISRIRGLDFGYVIKPATLLASEPKEIKDPDEPVSPHWTGGSI